MALKLIANYSKRLGLPGYSSHQFSVCVETEITSMDEVAAESSRLYQTLQQSVDDEIQSTGFVPDHGYGTGEQVAHNGPSQGNNSTVTPRSGSMTRNGFSNGNRQGNSHGATWVCSDKQRELIIKLVDEHQLDKGQLEATCQQMFGVGVKELNKLQASGLIDRILDEHGGRKGGRSRQSSPRRQYANGGAQ